jgi:hypothetical protein
VSAEIVTDRTTPTSYVEVIFRFNDNVTMSASTQYVAVIRHADGAAGDYFEVEGAASGTVANQNKSNENPAATWNFESLADLWFTVKATPVWHGQCGEKFRGITHEIVYDTEPGAGFTEDEILYWGTEITYDGPSGSFTVGNYVQFQPLGGGAVKNGGKILADTGTVLTVALEDISGNLLDNDKILEIGPASPASADINGTPATGTASGQDLGGGEGILLALDDNGTDGDVYIQLISGVAPVDNQQLVGRTSANTALVNATITGRTISPEFIGTSTGTNIIGAYGIGFQTTDVGASDLFFDLTNSPNQPPNNVTFTVTGLISNEDRVLVGPRTGSSLNRAQLQTDTTLSGAAETLVQCSTAIPSGTPTSGADTDNTRVRVELDSGIYRRVEYDSFTGNDFTLNVADQDWTGANASTAPKDVFVAYIDVLANAATEAYTAVYVSDVDLLVRVRDGGATPIKTFEGNATFGSTSSSIAAIRTSDA